MNKYPVWLDCDVGVDDAIAIMALHALEETDLLAISTVSGNVPLSSTFSNAHRMNGLMKTNYPVYKGADRPLIVQPQYAYTFHGKNGLGDVELPLPEDAKMLDTPAWDALYACAKQHPGELRLIAIGPLTNVAIALTKYPELKTLLHTILIMGGAAIGGNVTPAAEFNIYADPDAAQIVFKSGVPVVMCGLDVTMQAQILDLMNHLKEKRGTSILLITHDLGVVAKMADRIAVMYAGKIVEYGDARQVFYRPSHPYTWGLLGAMPNLIQDVKSELYAIPGTPPDLYAPPKGCAFAARCPYAMEACLKEDPPEFACGQGHGSRCWLLDPRAPDVTPPEGIPPLPKGGSDHV